MLPLIPKQLDSVDRRFTNDGDRSALPSKAPKKSVRFSADVADEPDAAAHQHQHAAHAAKGSRDDGSGSDAATLADGGAQGNAAGGKAQADFSTASCVGKHDEDAADAEGHGLLPSWRVQLRMPTVKWFNDIGTGTWRDVSYAILVSMATPAAFAPLPYALGRLTWVPGMLLLVGLWAASYYNAMLLANMHTWTVTMRQCRYRDLARSVWGDKGLYTVYIFQLIACISTNVAVQLACAFAMKDLYHGFHQDDDTSIFVFISAFAAAQLLLSQLPTMRHLRHLNVAAVACTAAFVVIVSIECITDGMRLDRSSVHHGLVPGQSAGQYTMEAFEAIGIMAYAYSNPTMPEIQSITKPPATRNGYKGISAAYAFVLVAYVTLTVSAYWAFGNNAAQLVVLSIKPVTSWTVTAAEITLQLVLLLLMLLPPCRTVNGALNYQIYARPSYEIIGLLLADPSDPNLMSMNHCIARLTGTSVYILTLAFVTSILPSAFGEIAAIVGVIGYVPMDLCLPLLLYNSARKPRWPRRVAHIAGSALAVVVGACAVAGAAYSLVNEARQEGLHVFESVEPREELSGVDLLVPKTPSPV